MRRSLLIWRKRPIIQRKSRPIRINEVIRRIRRIGNVVRSNSASRNKPRGLRNVIDLTNMQNIKLRSYLLLGERKDKNLL